MSRAKNLKTPGDVSATTEPLAPSAAPAIDDGLPNAVDVDPRFLRGPKLTRQGWVTPDEAWQKANAAEFEAALKAQG